MAINKQTLRTRALTSLVFVLLMFGGLLISIWGFIVLLAIILVGALIEYFRLAQKIGKGRILFYVLTAIVYIVLPIFLLADLGLTATGMNDTGSNKSSLRYSALIPCAIFFSLWINDTMAYLVGSVFGKTQLTAISPKKTWEGTIGGAVLCIISMGLLGPVLFSDSILQWQNWVLIACICAFFGTLGDLLESKLKRLANVKDSGSIMPGHGGFLDRFDSLFVAVPFVWLYIRLAF